MVAPQSGLETRSQRAGDSVRTPEHSRTTAHAEREGDGEILDLQRRIGNRAVVDLIKRSSTGLSKQLRVQRVLGLKPKNRVSVLHDGRRSIGDIVEVLADTDEYKIKFLEDEGLPEIHHESNVRKTASWENKSYKLPQETVDAISKTVGNAAGLPDLSEDQLEEMLSLLKAVPSPNLFLSGYIGTVALELEDLKKGNEKPEETERREIETNEAIVNLESTAFSGRFGMKPEGAEWGQLAPKIEEWWKEVKDNEKTINFAAAFKGNRMTARQINLQGRGGSFAVRKLGSVPDEANDRKIFLDNSVQGIEKRQSPENFADREKVNKEGVHDLSASLLRGSPDNAQIFSQLKYYSNSVVLFMPLPEENDLQILSALARVSGVDQKVVDAYKRQLTHPIYAQASDMGTVLVDTNLTDEGEGQFEYGRTGTVIRKKGDKARKVNSADMASRRKGALAYKEVATSAITRVNEIVMAYRKHESDLFPMYARWIKESKHFEVVDKDQKPTGAIVTNEGVYKAS